MRDPSKHESLIVGAVAIAVAFSLSWVAVGLAATIVVWLWLLAAAMLLLWLLERRSKLANVVAVTLALNTIFLFFLPKNIRAGIKELKQRENNAT